MRLMPLISAVLVLSLSRTAFAQEWIEFVSREDRFTCNFPSEPKITALTYTSEYGADLPARVYDATQGRSRYSVTVVDYTQAQRILTEKARACAAGVPTCKGGAGRLGGEAFWWMDVRGAMVFASWRFIQRNARVTAYLWDFIDLVEGHQLQLTNNADKSRTFASIYMHENKLYVMEGTVPAGDPEPGFFQQSLGWIDENGAGIRYQSIYSNGSPAPPRVNRAGRGQGASGTDAPGAGSRGVQK
jgi:hypothetical protein